MPGFDARHATRRARHTRVVLGLLAVAVVAVVLVLVLGRTTPPASAPSHHPRTAFQAPRIVTALASWRLAAPISRAAVVAGPPGAGGGNRPVLILGGETTDGLRADGAFALDVTSGALTQVGDLSSAIDGAAGAVIGSRALVFGGSTTASGTATTSSAVLSLSAVPASVATGRAEPISTTLGSLPQPRSEAAAVTAGSTTYLVGGGNGDTPDPDVLATADGSHFTVVSALPVPVLDPAVAVLGHTLYVFGGVAATGQPVDTIQTVNLATHRTTARLRLPGPLSGAVAFVIKGSILVAGGDTNGAVTGSTPTGATPSSATTVWWFDPSQGTARSVAQLPVAVSHAGLAVEEGTAWLVGGESNGTPVASAQSVTVGPAPGHGTTSTTSSTP
jgi:N-acetylneuraminic acid mutarotase